MNLVGLSGKRLWIIQPQYYLEKTSQLAWQKALGCTGVKGLYGNLLYCLAFLLPDAWDLNTGTPIWKSGQLRRLSGGVLVLVAQSLKTRGDHKPMKQFPKKIKGCFIFICRSVSRFHRAEQGSEAIIVSVLLAMSAMVSLFLWKDIWIGRIQGWVTKTIEVILAI